MSPSRHPCLERWAAVLCAGSARLAAPLLALLLAVLGGVLPDAEAAGDGAQVVERVRPALVVLTAAPGTNPLPDGAPPPEEDPEGAEFSDSDGEEGQPEELEPSGDGDGRPGQLSSGSPPSPHRAPGLVPLPVPCCSPELPCVTARQWRSPHPSRGPPRA